jgi:protein SDA1
MTEDLLADLIQYRTYKDKAVSTAAKSLTAVFREKNPQMLHRRMRGKPTEATYEELEKVRAYGDLDTKSFIPGAEIVAALDEEEKKNEGWEECSDEEGEAATGAKRPQKRKHSEDEEEDSDGEWVDVSDEEGDEKEVGEENPELAKLTLEEKRQRAIEISSEKIFSQEDFKRIRQEQIRKKMSDKNFVKAKDKGKISNKNIEINSDSDDEETKAAKRWVFILCFLFDFFQARLLALSLTKLLFLFFH